ncbi:hypothetical protein B0H14DRAFT_3443634 [Mycena olivaceomarginata]|nr:hypothetical protein B0H14DRAFT_3443634 [Mycena olivaceomarginata]
MASLSRLPALRAFYISNSKPVCPWPTFSFIPSNTYSQTGTTTTYTPPTTGPSRRLPPTRTPPRLARDWHAHGPRVLNFVALWNRALRNSGRRDTSSSAQYREDVPTDPGTARHRVAADKYYSTDTAATWGASLATVYKFIYSLPFVLPPALATLRLASFMALPPLAPVGKYKSTVGVCEAGKARGADTVPTTVGRGGGVGVGVHSAHSTMSAAAWTIPLPTQQTRRVQPPARARLLEASARFFFTTPIAISNARAPPPPRARPSPPDKDKSVSEKAASDEGPQARVVGSELIQKYLGDGPKLVREMFRVAASPQTTPTPTPTPTPAQGSPHSPLASVRDIEPLHIGYWFLNMHAPPPFRWQHCQALLCQHLLLLSWLAPGRGFRLEYVYLGDPRAIGGRGGHGRNCFKRPKPSRSRADPTLPHTWTKPARIPSLTAHHHPPTPETQTSSGPRKSPTPCLTLPPTS